MEKKVGVCTYIDCKNYNQKIEVEPGSDFECPECHHPLQEPFDKKSSKGTGKNPKLIILIIVVVLIIAAVVAFFMTRKGANTNPSPEPQVTEQQTEQSVATEAVDSTQNESASQVPEAAQTVEQPQQAVNKPAAEASTSKVSGRGTVDLGYGTYAGDLKNGVPHGYGVITYRKSHQIVSSKDYMANPGDTFEGDFRDGKISGLGYWNHDGNKTAVKP